MSSDHHKPNPGEVVAEGMTRRVFTRVLGLLGVAFVADNISQGAISNKLMSVLSDEDAEAEAYLESEGVSQHLEAAAETIANELKESGETDPNTIMMKTVNYLGTGLFVQGVLQLIFIKENNHINSYQFAALGALTGLKYQLSNPEEKEHLIKETEGAMKTFALISSAMTIGEGVNADIAGAWESAKGEKPKKKDLIALMTTLSVGISSVGTTLVNAPIARQMALDLANTGEMDEKGNPILDPAVMAICTGHNANVSGIGLFGNPPFMAVCEKFGFAEGIKWKLQTMWPLAMYSWASSTFKLNLVMAHRAGLSGTEAAKQAGKDTVEGLTKPENIKFFAETIIKSLGNAAKYFTGQELSAQSAEGIRMKIGESILGKLTGVVNLLFSEEAGPHSHEGEGMVHPQDLELNGGMEIAEALLAGMATNESVGETPNDTLNEAIKNQDWDAVLAWGAANGVPNIHLHIKTLKDFADNKKVDDSTTKTESSKEKLKKALSPIGILDRSTDINRIKGHLGHNLADVVNVFPFQSGCVPFLTPVLKEIISKLEEQGLTGTSKEITLFFLIQFFSSVADNYVACKVGLELLPNKPQIALIASENPWHNPISNMSNLAQFSMNEFSLKQAIKTLGWHVESSAVALAYSQFLGILNQVGIALPPEAPLDPTTTHAANNTPSGVQNGTREKISRRGLFQAFTKAA
jgi:hypothetical protein